MSNKQVYIFGFAMTFVVAIVLAGLRQATAPLAAYNAEIFNKRAILSAVAGPLQKAGKIKVDELSDDQVQEIFEKQVTQYVIDAEGTILEDAMAIDVDMAVEKKKAAEERVYPIYKLNMDGENYYIFSVIGNGLWDLIWGNIALESDLNTIAGVSFDHAGETPGLGAEIKDNSGWKQQFYKKQIFDNGRLVGVNVKKGGATEGSMYEVDGLSGATVTADGVTDMIFNGMSAYENYISELRSEEGNSMLN